MYRFSIYIATTPNNLFMSIKKTDHIFLNRIFLNGINCKGIVVDYDQDFNVKNIFLKIKIGNQGDYIINDFNVEDPIENKTRQNLFIIFEKHYVKTYFKELIMYSTVF